MTTLIFSGSKPDPYWADWGENRPRITGDFETRSAANLKKVGGWKYSLHPTTQPICFAYLLPGEDPHETESHLWHAGFKEAGIPESAPPEDLFDALADGHLFEAHNSFFEWVIWHHVMVPQYGWPALNPDNIRCSAAKASYYALPRDLDGAARVVNSGLLKDKDGNRIMLQVSKPRKPRKDELFWYADRLMDPPEYFWYNDRERLETTFEYCRQDVRAEAALSEALPDLPPRELQIWQMDQRLNRRGVQCDVDLAEAAVELRAEWVKKANQEIAHITGATSSQARQALRDWLFQEYNIKTPNLDKVTLEAVLRSDKLDETGKYVMNLVAQANKTSVKKFNAMIEAADPETGRLHDLMMYHGAMRTGRWSGKLVQPHNFPRGDIKTKFDKDGSIVFDGMELVCDAIKTRDLQWFIALYGHDVIEVMSSALRGAFTASPGKTLTVADYAAIEARVVFWLAGDDTALEVFRQGEDIYCDLASSIYNRKITKADADERQMGKQGILGLGFGMGAPKFLATCAKYNMKVPRRLAIKVVKLYRDKYKAVKQFWHDMEAAAKATVETGQPHQVNDKIFYDMAEYGSLRFLRMHLPSGKCLHYPNPTLRPTTTVMYSVCERLTHQQYGHYLKTGELPEGVVKERHSHTVNRPKSSWLHTHEAKRQMRSWKGKLYTQGGHERSRPGWPKNAAFSLLPDEPLILEDTKLWFEGMDQKTRKWTDIDTYGGKLTENAVQATARELMAEAMLRCDESERYAPLLSVHDEMIGESSKNEASLERFIELMTELPDWAEGCPVDAEAWIAPRYRK
jgi:DNA polymerase